MNSMRRVRRAALRQKESTELNITAFMNLMVVLVPFLLVMAVFSRIAILELNLPSGEAAKTLPPSVLDLEVVVRHDGILVQDRHKGALKHLPLTSEGQQNLVGLSAYLRKVKAKFPDKQDATILLEPDIPYELLVQVMDTLRVAEVDQGKGKPVRRIELFPEIAIGDAAPAREGHGK